jgi:hypothetical protein
VRTNSEILQQFADVIVPEMKAVSKRFADSIEAEVTDTSLVITASPYINVLIDGRRPTRIGAPKGNPTLQQIIRKWIDEKGITPRIDKSGRLPTKDQLSWAISKSIHLYGDRLYQRGGGNNIYDSIITPQRIDNLLSLLADQYYTIIKSITVK